MTYRQIEERKAYMISIIQRYKPTYDGTYIEYDGTTLGQVRQIGYAQMRVLFKHLTASHIQY